MTDKLFGPPAFPIVILYMTSLPCKQPLNTVMNNYSPGPIQIHTPVRDVISMPSNTELTSLNLSKPFFLIRTERTKGSDTGKYFWSPNMYVDDEKPSGYEIQENTYVTRLSARSNFDPPVNECKIVFNKVAGSSVDIVPGDKLELFLGYYKKAEPAVPDYAKAFTGFVSSVERGLTDCGVAAISSVHSLLSLRRHMVLNQDTIDNVIRKLAEESENVAINEISASEIQKTRYIFEESRNMYENIKDLCIQGGLDLYMDVHDKFIAKVWEPGQPSPGDLGLEKIYPDTLDGGNTDQHIHNFYFGLNIMNLEVKKEKAAVSSVEIRSFSDYGEENECQYSIDKRGVVKEFEGDEKEYSPEEHRIIYLPFTPKESAEKIAENLIAFHNPGLEGTLSVVGSPHVRLNDGVRVAGKFFGEAPLADIVVSPGKWDAATGGESAEEDSGEGKIFQVVGVEHVFDLKRGFYSLLDLNEREPPEPEGLMPEELAVAEEAAAAAEEAEELTGESEIAPEYPKVADEEIASMKKALKDLEDMLDDLKDSSL